MAGSVPEAADLVVTDPIGPKAARPASTVELTLDDYQFALSRPLDAGRHLVHIRNQGREPHEADVFRLPDRATVNDYTAWLQHEVGLPPVEPVGGIGDVVPGNEIWLELDLRPGRYFILCTVTAATDSQPHYRHGMLLEFTVK